MFLSTVATIGSCSGDDLPEPEEILVVEGWIDDRGFPVVIVSKNLPVSYESTDLSDISDRLVRWAKVAVVCDNDTVVLTGKVNNEYFPPFVYTTTRIRGVSGKEYKLIVDYHDYHITATTTIPQRPVVDSIVVSTSEEDTLLYKVNLYFKDNPDEKNYYKALVKMGTRSQQFLPCYLGTISDDNLKAHNNKISISRASLLTEGDYHTPYFYPNDTILVKFAQIDKQAYRFWCDFEDYCSFSRNPLFPVTSNIRSNINGGIGYWCGYGAITKPIVFK